MTSYITPIRFHLNEKSCPVWGKQIQLAAYTARIRLFSKEQGLKVNLLLLLKTFPLLEKKTFQNGVQASFRYSKFMMTWFMQIIVNYIWW